MDPIGAWLREHHPAIDFVDVDGAPRDPGPDEAWETALRLARRLFGLRQGWWVLAPAGGEGVRVELEGAQGGWWWGEARRVRLERSDRRAAGAGGAGAGAALLEIEGADPFALVFVAGAQAATAAPGSTREGGGALELSTGPPRARLERVAIAWQDRGRPAAQLAGVEETLRRLRAQGYL
jgi:hypothetical protein